MLLAAFASSDIAPDTATATATAGLTALWEHLAQRWAFLGLGAGIVVVAALVNRFAPSKRRRIRRTLIPFFIYIVLWAISATFAAGDAPDWADRIHTASELFEIYAIINLTGLAVFDLALPALKIEPAVIVADLIIGGGYIVGTIAILRSNGMDLGSVVATSAIVSGILALSLQATLGNILGGVALQLDHSIHSGDWIQLPDGTQGKVREVHWRHTVVETRNWDTILVPNSSLLASNIVILGKRHGGPLQHRMWVYFNVDFRYAPGQVIGVVQEALRSAPIERVAMDPPPNVICYDFAKDGRDSFAYYAVRYWLTDLAVDDPTSSAVREHVYAALRRANIPLARATQTVLFAPDDSVDVEARASRHRAARTQILSGIELFRPLTDVERNYIADHLVYAPFAKGETITRQGAVAHWLYILVSGRAEIRAKVEHDAKPRLVATLEAPALFGEMGLMTGETRTADVVALTDVECYRLDKTAFEQIIHDRPEIAEAMAKTMAKRRIELGAALDGVPVASRRGEELGEADRILGGIRSFFGLGGATRDRADAPGADVGGDRAPSPGARVAPIRRGAAPPRACLRLRRARGCGSGRSGRASRSAHVGGRCARGRGDRFRLPRRTPLAPRDRAGARGGVGGSLGRGGGRSQRSGEAREPAGGDWRARSRSRGPALRRNDGRGHLSGPRRRGMGAPPARSARSGAASRRDRRIRRPVRVRLREVRGRERRGNTCRAPGAPGDRPSRAPVRRRARHLARASPPLDRGERDVPRLRRHRGGSSSRRGGGSFRRGGTSFRRGGTSFRRGGSSSRRGGGSSRFYGQVPQIAEAPPRGASSTRTRIVVMLSRPPRAFAMSINFAEQASRFFIAPRAVAISSSVSIRLRPSEQRR